MFMFKCEDRGTVFNILMKEANSFDDEASKDVSTRYSTLDQRYGDTELLAVYGLEALDENVPKPLENRQLKDTNEALDLDFREKQRLELNAS